MIEGVRSSNFISYNFVLEAGVLESKYQAQLIKELRHRFPECVVLKNDCNYMQGIPDLTVLLQDKWVVLEVKASEDAVVQPNQGYYIQKLNDMSFAAFIYPENEEEVLSEISQFLLPRGPQ